MHCLNTFSFKEQKPVSLIIYLSACFSLGIDTMKRNSTQNLTYDVTSTTRKNSNPN